MEISFNLNGVDVCFDIPSNLRVIDLLREHLNLTGTKEACGSGECGACTILSDNVSKLSCLMLAAQLQNRNIITIEGLANGDTLHPVQKEFIKKGAVQCGFCTSGMILAAINLLNKKNNPSRIEIRRGISGNLCRCTGYQKIVDAIESVSKKYQININSSVKSNSKSFKIINKSILKQVGKVFLPKTLTELWEIMKNSNAVIYAGGTDVVTKRRKGIIDANKSLICIERIFELQKIEERENEIFIGAAATHTKIAENPIIKKNFPVLTQAIEVLGSPPIRNMGTIGGNICTASPAGDTLPPLFALNAELEIRSESSRRIIPIKEFIKGPGVVSLQCNEILYGIIIKKQPEYNFSYYEKVGQRNALSISIAGIAILARISEKKIIEKIKIAWGSVAPGIVTSNKIEEKLVGKTLTESELKSVFPLIEKVVSPINDIRASKEYRKILSKNLLMRLLELSS